MHSKIFLFVAAAATMVTAAPTNTRPAGDHPRFRDMDTNVVPKPYVQVKNPRAPNALQPMVLDLVNHSTMYLNKILDFAATAGDKPDGLELSFYQMTTERFAKEIKKVIEVPEWIDGRYGNVDMTDVNPNFDPKDWPIEPNHVPYVPVVNPNDPFADLDLSYDTPIDE